jgi:predicted alpha/beta superfamily hydrolase
VRPDLPLLATLALTACTPAPGAPTTTQDASTGAPSSWGTSEATGTSEPTGTGEPTPTTGPASTSEPATGTTTESSSTGDPLGEDEALLRQAIAGEVDPGDALRTIAGRGGLPVETADGDYLFACLCGPGHWQLAGDHDAWAGADLQPAGPLLWLEAEVPAPDNSLYKFHDTEAEQWIADPLGRRHGHDNNGRFSLVRASAPHLERWYDLAGAGLQPRDLEVFVPQDGAFTHALYVHDGQNLFDPEAPFGNWQLQNSAPPGLLLVGIDNTPARMDEYTPVPDIISQDEIGGQAAAYAELLETVIRPRMEAAYGAAPVVGTMGSSLGGLVSLVIADLYPDRYDMAISLSGTMGWGSITLHNQTIIERYAAAGKRDVAIYIDSGGDGPCGDLDMDGVDDDTQDADNYCENAQLRDVLTGLGYSEGADFWYVWEPDAEHNEAFWAGRVGVPMAAFMGL